MKKVLIANRGEIAVRIMRTCREMGLVTVAVASEADAASLHAQCADECHVIGPAPATESYLDGPKIIETALATGADAIHPGFGFLSENAGFAKAVTDAGLIFIGPDSDVIRKMGSKQQAKRIMAEAGVPVVPGYDGEDQQPERLSAEAEKIGFPLLIKASAGGGGKGMRVVTETGSFEESLATAKREAKSAFGDDTVLLEKYLAEPRHIEFQVFGDSHGNTVHLFERECSIQRRHQKILEETPSTALDDALRASMAEAAVKAAETVGYTNAGTVELMLAKDGSFYFLEMNTRLQVEHPITEMLTGLDLVRWQIEVARGKPLPLCQAQIGARGHAIEVRIYAEDPDRQFLPQTGTIRRYHEPHGLDIRVDSGVQAGDEVSIYYDPMLAKLIARAANREEARQKLRHALADYCIHGVKTNIPFLRAILDEPNFMEGNTTTAYLDRHFPDTQPSETLLEHALALTGLAGGPSPRNGSNGQAAADRDPWDRLPQWRGIS